MTELAKFIEHTILRPDTTLADVRRVCEEAIQHQFAGVCIPPLFVRDARRIVGDMSRVRVVTVVGFPMGYNAIAAKSEEIKRAIDEGTDDIDAVINISALKSDNWNHVTHDIDSVARATHMRGKTMKLILECGLLTEPEIKKVAEIAREVNIMWLKTGTGMHGHPATPEMVRTLSRLAGPDFKIKASGGIRTAKEAQALVDAGAERLGTSASLQIIGK
jgi:deoxyribose-phosphate aldolase